MLPCFLIFSIFQKLGVHRVLFVYVYLWVGSLKSSWLHCSLLRRACHQGKTFVSFFPLLQCKAELLPLSLKK
ncbi:hypothetical protein Zm00014a_008943 [Zea mays]|uniref:Uncharacterized protein n=1 Tax=Zea mays TaxID=4577 RepID=A0A3L6EIM6_MAIZE|nr:hypothetical protein Zm00014a_008943 [Zea mays]